VLSVAPLHTLDLWSSKYINSTMWPPFCQLYKKVVLRLSEHGDVIETQAIDF